MPKLTKRAVDTLAPQANDYFVWDNEIKGFGVRVWPSGKRVYVVQYRYKGKLKRLTLGPHGPLTCDEARKEAIKRLGDVYKGVDPSAEKQKARTGVTVAEFCDIYLEDAHAGLIMGKRNLPKKMSTIATDTGRINHFIKPVLGSMKMKDVASADVLDLLNDISRGKKSLLKNEPSGKKRGVSRVTGGKGTASKTVGLLSSIFKYAITKNIVTQNPTSGVARPADGKRKRRLSDHELKRLGKAIFEAEHEHWQGIAFILMVCLMGWRRSEVHTLKWSYLILDHNTVQFPDTKEGDSIRPVPNAMVEFWSSMVRGNQFVLPSIKGGSSHYKQGYRVFKRLCETASIPDASPHTMRHTLISIAQEIGFSESVAGEVCGHVKSGSVTGSVYTHFAPEYLIEASNCIAEDMVRRMDLHLMLRRFPSKTRFRENKLTGVLTPPSA